MLKPDFFTHLARARRFLLFGFLALLLFIIAPAVVLAAPDAQEPPEGETCARCHWQETAAWEQSPHAAKDVACETCHGSYVEGHPDTGIMQLGVDSQSCQGCHQETTQQWKASMHAEKDVQCINCHVSHSQDTRLSQEWLCGACHPDQIHDFTHTSHHAVGVTCIDCHSSAPEGTEGVGA